MHLNTYLATMLALSLLRAAMHPVVVRRGLFPVLPDAHITECRFARQLGPIHQRANAIDMSNYFTRRAFHTRSMFLQLVGANVSIIVTPIMPRTR